MLCHPHMECACTPNAHNPCKLDTQRVRGHFKCIVERVCSLSSEEAHRMQVHSLIENPQGAQKWERSQSLHQGSVYVSYQVHDRRSGYTCTFRRLHYDYLKCTLLCITHRQPADNYRRIKPRVLVHTRSKRGTFAAQAAARRAAAGVKRRGGEAPLEPQGESPPDSKGKRKVGHLRR